MEDSNFFLGAFFAILFISATLWHLRENSQLEKQISSKTDDTTSKWLVRFAWSRTLQLLGALACAIVLIMHYDIELSRTQSTLDSLVAAVERKELHEQSAAKQDAIERPAPAALAPLPSAPVSANMAPQAPVAPVQPQQPVQPRPQQPAPLAQQQPPAIQTAPAIQLQQPQPQQPPQAQGQVQVQQPQQQPQQQVQQQQAAPQTQPLQAGIAPLSNTAIPPINSQQQQPGVYTAQSPSVAGAAQQQPPANPNGTAIEAIYSPERTGGDKQSAMDDLKKRYEDIFVIYMFLKKCGRVNATDYNIITNALSQEMANIQAPSSLQYNILTSAQGSYSEIYSKSPCDGNGINDLNDQYISYIKVLSDSFPPRQAPAPATPQ